MIYIKFDVNVDDLHQYMSEYDIDIHEMLNVKGFAEDIKANPYTILHHDILDTDFTKRVFKRSKRIGYHDLDEFFNKTKKVIKSNRSKKYIHAYWPYFDGYSHEYGIDSKRTEKHFKELAKRLEIFIKSIKGTNTTLIITADHGLIDTKKEKVIFIDDHPKLIECLTLPLCGETRFAYCYVRPSKTKQFENYIKTRLSKYCEVYKSEELINKGLFGLYKHNEKLHDRVGDYILVLKDNYILREEVMGEKRSFLIGNHGGLSKDELYVPLIVVKV